MAEEIHTDRANPSLAGNAFGDDPLLAIENYVRVSDALATAGQPTEAQLVLIAQAGFEVIINLGLNDPLYGLADEHSSVEALGIGYVHIPVQFAAPKQQQLTSFSKALREAGNARVFVHCRHNKRVPVFIALDRVLRQGWRRADALAAMRTVWVPDVTWERFIAATLSDKNSRA